MYLDTDRERRRERKRERESTRTSYFIIQIYMRDIKSLYNAGDWKLIVILLSFSLV